MALSSKNKKRIFQEELEREKARREINENYEKYQEQGKRPKNFVHPLITLGAFVFLALFIIGLLKFENRKQTAKARIFPDIPKYSILQQNDMSFKSCTRKELRLKVYDKISKSDIKLICNEILGSNREYKNADAVAFLFYDKHSNVNNHYTLGKAVWAPDGNWAYAAEPKYRNNREIYKLKIEIGSAVGEIPDKMIANEMPVEERIKIFKAVKAEMDKLDKISISKIAIEYKNRKDFDRIIAEENAKRANEDIAIKNVANAQGVNIDLVGKITTEGFLKGW